MTTMTIQEELGKLGTVTAADLKKEAVAQAVFRPQEMHPVVSGHAYVEITGIINKSGVTKDGDEWTGQDLGLRFSRLSNIKVARGRQPFTESSFDYTMPYKDVPHPTSILGRTIMALGEQHTILSINGAECDFEEVVVPARTDKDGNIRQTKGRDGKMYNEKPMFYYRFYNIGGAQPTAATTATDQGELIACGVAAGKTDAELEKNAFAKEVNASFSAARVSDDVVLGQILSGKFLPRMVSEGKLNKLEDGAYALN